MRSVCKNCNKPILNPVNNCFCWWREKVEEFRKEVKRLEDIKSPIQLLDTSKNFVIWLEGKTKKVGKNKIKKSL